MKDRYKIIREEWNTATGTTKVTINTDCGAFTGSVKLDDIDAKYPSTFHANELALSKALRKYAKQMALITREKLKPLKAVMEQCKWVDNHSSNIVWSQATYLIRKEIEKLEEELKLWNTRAIVMSNTIKNRIAARDRIVKTYLQKDKNN